MRRFLLTLLLAGGLLPAASAMDFRQVGDTLVMSGPVDDHDLVRLRNHLATHRVALVLLHESPGGDLWNGYQIGNRLRDEGLPTAVSGKCESACALIFLAGTERSFTDGRPAAATMVGLHGAHAIGTGRPLPELSPRMAYMIRTMTGHKYPDDLLQRTVYPRNAQDMVYAFHPGRYPLKAPGRGIVQCLKRATEGFDCSMLQGLDALGIGILTNPQVMVLPREVKEALQDAS